MQFLKARRFFKDRDGMAAVEFALIAPVMVVLFFGTVECCNALTCDQKVSSLAATAADLVAQDSTISASQMNDVYSALDSIVYPFPKGGIKVVITSVVSDGKGGAKVDWSTAENTDPREVDSSVNLPDGLLTSATSVIMAEVKYDYSSTTTHFVAGSITMSDTFYSRPRKSAKVLYTG